MLPVPDVNALIIDELNILLEVSFLQVFCLIFASKWIKTSCWTARPFVLYHLFQKVIEQVNTRCKMIVVAPWWPMMHWLWGLVSHSTKPPLQLLHWSQKQPFSQKYHLNLLHWHLHAWHLNTTQNLLYHSLGKG